MSRRIETVPLVINGNRPVIREVLLSALREADNAQKAKWAIIRAKQLRGFEFEPPSIVWRKSRKEATLRGTDGEVTVQL